MRSSVGQTTPPSTPMCPMGSVCRGMMSKPFSGVWLSVWGVGLIALGVLIVIEPRILLWVIAASFVLFGCMMLVMVGLMRRMFNAIPHHD